LRLVVVCESPVLDVDARTMRDMVLRELEGRRKR